MLTDSVGQTLRRGRAGMTYLCSLIYGASAEELKCWGWNHLKQCCLIELSAVIERFYICPVQYGSH